MALRPSSKTSAFLAYQFAASDSDESADEKREELKSKQKAKKKSRSKKKSRCVACASRWRGWGWIGTRVCD